MNNSYDKISQTAILTAYPRIFTDIPFSKEIFEEFEKRRKEKNLGEISLDLKVPKLAPELEARYKLVDKLLKQNQTTQILEIASGFSARGIEWAKNPNIEYVEVELAGLLEEKEEIIKKIIEIPENLHLKEGNALSLEDLRDATRFFKKEKRIAVVHEGLLRYLNFEEKALVAKNVHSFLEEFGGVWITPDITLKKLLEVQEESTMPGKNKQIAELTGKEIDQNRFENEEAAQEFFKSFGFEIERHSLLEVRDDLVSPQRLNLSADEVDKMIGSAVVYVMRLN
jgi:O-methyltransferase involved in polyketide biosynthesis